MSAIRIDLSKPITWEGALSGLGSFARWWWSELRELIPPRWLIWAQASFERRTITLGGTVWHIVSPTRPSEALALDMAAPDAVLHDLVSRLDPACLSQRLDAQIPEGDGLLRRIQLPAAAEQRLRSVVRLQLDRLSPFRGDDVRFDCRRIGLEKDGMIEVDVAIVPKTTLEAYEERLKSIGLVVGSFRFGDTPLRLVPVEKRWTRQEKAQMALGALAAAVWIGAILFAPLSRDSELARLSEQVASLRAPAASASIARDELRHMQGPVAAASARLAQPAALDVLRLLTELLPDDVQLSELTIDGGTTRLRGQAHSAKQILALLNKSGRFRQAHLVGLATRDSSDRERFEIEMSVLPSTSSIGGAQ